MLEKPLNFLRKLIGAETEQTSQQIRRHQKSVNRAIQANYQIIDSNSINEEIRRISENSRMPGSKKTILLANLRGQLNITNNQFQVRQIKGSTGFNLNQAQIFNPNLRSSYQNGFFSCDDAVGQTAIIDFANDRFGGGALGNAGFVQEEKMLMETNLLTSTGAYTGLTKNPLYIRALQTHRFVGPGRQLYGEKSLRQTNIHPGNLDNYYQAVPKPQPINIIAMAAIDMHQNRYQKYQVSNLETMFNTAYKAFKAHAERGGTTVQTGPWGAGVFGNSENVTCVLQILAAQAAGVKLIYHGNQDAYQSAIRFLRGPYIQGKSYTQVFESICNYMQKRHHGRDFWRPKG